MDQKWTLETKPNPLVLQLEDHLIYFKNIKLCILFVLLINESIYSPSFLDETDQSFHKLPLKIIVK